MTEIINTLSEHYLFLLLALLVVNAGMRTRKNIVQSKKKRTAALIFLAIAVFFWLLLFFITEHGLPEYYFPVALAAVVVFGFAFRQTLWPFKLDCQNCGKRLSISQFLVNDDNICAECYLNQHPELRPVPPKTEEQIRQEMLDKFAGWQPVKQLVLCFVCNDKNEVLLIDRKYKPKGIGKISGATGFFNAGDDVLDACRQAVAKETGLTIHSPVFCGNIRFTIPNANLLGHIFTASDFSGDIRETKNNRPFWTRIKKLPFSQMSVDYQVWLRLALTNKKFEYYAICNDKGFVMDDLLLEEKQ